MRNYIAELNAFHDIAELNQLSTGQIALWYALMYANNLSMWSEWFTCSSSTLQIHSGLSRQGLIKARNQLKQMGMLEYRQNGTKAGSYHLAELSTMLSTELSTSSKSVQGSMKESELSTGENDKKLSTTSNSVQDSVQGSLQDSIQGSVQGCLHIDKLNNTKLNNNIYNNARVRETHDNLDMDDFSKSFPGTAAFMKKYGGAT